MDKRSSTRESSVSGRVVAGNMLLLTRNYKREKVQYYTIPVPGLAWPGLVWYCTYTTSTTLLYCTVVEAFKRIKAGEQKGKNEKLIKKIF